MYFGGLQSLKSCPGCSQEHFFKDVSRDTKPSKKHFPSSILGAQMRKNTSKNQLKNRPRIGTLLKRSGRFRRATDGRPTRDRRATNARLARQLLDPRLPGEVRRGIKHPPCLENVACISYLSTPLARGLANCYCYCCYYTVLYCFM